MSIQNKYSSSLHTLVLPSFTDYQYITILEDVLIHKSDFSTASGFMLSQEARPNTLQKKHVWTRSKLCTDTSYCGTLEIQWI